MLDLFTQAFLLTFITLILIGITRREIIYYKKEENLINGLVVCFFGSLSIVWLIITIKCYIIFFNWLNSLNWVN